jgi:hypothetical protein
LAKEVASMVVIPSCHYEPRGTDRSRIGCPRQTWKRVKQMERGVRRPSITVDYYNACLLDANRR